MDNIKALQEREIASTILKQIKATDFWALGAWGANQYISLNAGPGPENIGPICGGVQFKVKTPKYSKGVRVIIYYTADDLYTVRVIRIIGTTVTEIETSAGIYFDSLVDCIDRIIENERRRG